MKHSDMIIGNNNAKTVLIDIITYNYANLNNNKTMLYCTVSDNIISSDMINYSSKCFS